MAPHLTESTSFSDDDSITDSQLAQSCNLAIDLLLEQVAIELEWMKDHKDDSNHGLHRFPPACYRMVKSLPGNDICMDCGSRGTDWASTSYGVLLCLLCSARHRSLGVKVSTVRSLTLDHWSHEQVLCMLEGGNNQLYNFFDRHRLAGSSKNPIHQPCVEESRYRTKAARFYREHLVLHVEGVTNTCALYEGREASRKTYSQYTMLSTTSTTLRRYVR